MTLLFQFMALLFGIILVAVLGIKGFFLNFVLVLAIGIINKIFSQNQIIFILLTAVAFYFLSIYINNIIKKKYDPLPFREMLLGGSAISLLVGMIIRPFFAGTVLGPVLGIPVLRRLTRLGFKAILLTFAGFLLRLLYSIILNLYLIIKLL